MDLYATGFNARRQLDFEATARHGLAPNGMEPCDKYDFTRILTGESIERPFANFAGTTVQRNGTFQVAGVTDDRSREFQQGMIIAEADNGEILKLGDNNTLLHYADRASSLNPGTEIYSRSWDSPVKQIVAFSTGFVIRFEDGSVATMSDPRYENCLGRVATARSPATEPCLVHDLSHLGSPIVHVAAAGFALAALTAGGDLYFWGENRHVQDLAMASEGVPSYASIDNDKEVKDVAIGVGHIIVLTTDNCVYVLGQNSNGQLGVGRDIPRVPNWTLIYDAREQIEIMAVAAGPVSSFIVTGTARSVVPSIKHVSPDDLVMEHILPRPSSPPVPGVFRMSDT